MKIERRKSRIPYTKEERYKMFTEGRVRGLSHIEVNKKAYKRQAKHKKTDL